MTANNGNSETTPLVSQQNKQNNVEQTPNIPSADYLEEQRRVRLCLALAIFSILAALIGALAVWRVQVAYTARQAQRSSVRAAAVLARLNRHVMQKIPKNCETTLILMRHCEKALTPDADGNEHCSYVGLERSHYLATLFGKHLSHRWPLPEHLFAFAPERASHSNYRQYETLVPLSLKADVVIELVKRQDFAANFLDLLTTNSVCGKVSIVSWRQQYLPELAVELGCGPQQGCPETFDENEYDQVWLLKYVYRPVLESITEHDLEPDNDNGENLMMGQNHTRHKKKKKGSKHGWEVYATVVQQNFDPLAFSKKSGDYPEGGTPSGGAWRTNEL